MSGSVVLLAAASYSAKTLGILLWMGLAVLSVGVIALMRTRWGQTKPISKCVGLSVFAHILFCGYAYGTKLVFEAPPGPVSRVVKLKAFDAGESRQDSGEGSRRETQAWDQLADKAHPDINAPQPRPRMSEPLEDLEPASVETPKLTPSPADLALAAEPARPAATPPKLDLPKPAAPAPSAAQIEQPAPEQRAAAEPIGPAAGKLQRAATSDLDEVAKVEPPPKVPSELLDTSPSVPLTADHPTNGDLRGSPTISALPVARATDARGGSTGLPVPPLGARPVPRRPASGDEIPEMYQSRVSPDRLGAARQHGGNARTEGAVEAALQWLAANQSADGRWDASQFGAGRETKTLGHDRGGAGAEADTGVTGLALLAFLAAGHTHLEGKYRENVQHGLEFLVRTQRDDGYLAGRAELFASMYCHGMASLAISEAYAMTGDQRLRPFVEKAVRYTVSAQHAGSGGWRYQPAEQGDMSQFGWQLMALKSAELAGIDIPDRTRAGMARFLRSVSSGQHRGLASYRAGEGATRTMTAEGLVCRMFLDVDRGDATIAEGADFVVQELPRDGKPNLYYWYYGTLALYQLQDSRWQRWNEALQTQLLARQRTDGELAGSFDTDDAWGGYGGRVYTTAIAALCLEVYYRYLPLYEQRRQK